MKSAIRSANFKNQTGGQMGKHHFRSMAAFIFILLAAQLACSSIGGSNPTATQQPQKTSQSTKAEDT
jgi:hypothetical protein